MKHPINSMLSLLMGWIICISASCNANSNGSQKAGFDTLPSPTPVDITIPGGFSEQTVLKFDSLKIETFLKQYPEMISYSKEIREFYSNRNFTYAWYDHSGLIEQAGNLYNRLSNMNDEGLSARIPYPEVFHSMMDADTAGIGPETPNPSLELMLTAQYFFYARHVWTGLGEKGIRETKWDLPRKKVSYSALLDSLLAAPSESFLATEPVYPQYSKLKTYLKQYRRIEEAGGWPYVKIPKKGYRMGDSSSEIRILRKRLHISGDLEEDNTNAVFDNQLDNAVKRYQRRNGMKDDGIAGKAVITELNIPVNKRIEQIIVNMERCRWLPVAMNRDYFVINIPAFTFYAYEQDSLAWSMKVVVGKAIHQTAIFNGKLQYVVFSPYWNIPPGIMAKEILPAIRRNRHYLAANNMEWNGRQIRQKPGPDNALGLVKFLFPNSHNIYLHDTPVKSLFEQDQRAFSHGCIRVEQPKRLAMYVLRNQPEWTEEKIDAAMQSGREQYVTVKQPIPVLIAYFTAWVDEEGMLNFRKDIYSRDQRLAEMILEKK